MSPPFAHAKITLKYPLYAADFDPQNNGFLLVGGGGGEGRSGVGNKITLLDSSKRETLSEVVDIELSREEDSVTSLAYAQSTETWATAFAGVNSSTAEQNQGNNEHLRSFLLDYPPQKGAGAEKDTDNGGQQPEPNLGTKALGRVSLFTPSTATKKETYQRILRLSEKRRDNGPRVGAIATGLAPIGEIVVFAANTSRASLEDVRGRVSLEEKEEAADVDLVDLESSEEKKTKGDFRMAYCTDYEVFIAEINYNYNRKAELDTSPIFRIAGSKARPRFRLIRFLTPTLLLVIQNLVGGKGSELIVLETSGNVILRKKLHKSIKSATALSVTALPYQSSGVESIQHAIAVAGADTSITVFTLDHAPQAPYGTLKLQKHLLEKNVHPTSITSLTFSTHNPPTTIWTATPPQYLKLASTSIANTCVVYTFPLTPHPPPKKGLDEVPGYLLAGHGKSNITQTTLSVVMALLAIALGAFCLQAFTEIRGGSPEFFGAKEWLPQSVHDLLAKPYMFEEGIPSTIETPVAKVSEAVQTPMSQASEAVEPPVESFYGAMGQAKENVKDATGKAEEKVGLRDLLKNRNMGSDTSDNGNDGPDIIVHHSSDGDSEKGDDSQGTLSFGTRSADHHKARKWEDLAEHEKVRWKTRLLEAGEWTLEEGESVLKGVCFSGLGNAIGAAVGGG